MSVLLVTGTDTDVGKTVATAAIAACATGSVAVVKPAQTGVAAGEPGDLAEVTRLSGVTDVHEFARYPDPLSPHHAAMLTGRRGLVYAEVVRRIVDLDALHDLVLVEGAGGLLVPFDSDDRWTLLDLSFEVNAALVLVTRPGLGTLNHTQLTIRAIEDAGAAPAGLIIGRWPREPDSAMRHNVADLHRMGHGLAGVLPEGMAAMRDFRRRARAALGPQFGGTFDARAFAATQQP